MAAPDYFQRKPSYNRSRSGLGATAGAISPASPHTPLLTRSLSSQFASPEASYRHEEECLVYEINSRFFRAGVAGDSAPRCIIPFGPNQGKRLHDFNPPPPPPDFDEDATREWELWELDVRNADFGLIEDKIERALRDAHTNYLMLDQRARKVILVLPSALPHPLVSSTLNTIFNAFQPASVQLWSTPVLCAVSAGLRSALVLNIGWHETTVTALYEYRQVFQQRSSRSAKHFTRKMAEALRQHTSASVSFEAVEDIVNRMAWCRTTSQQRSDETVVLPLKNSTKLPFETLADPAEETFFSTSVPLEHIDDYDLPVHLLAYKCLLSLPLDVRAICVSRIVITGDVSNLPGLKPRLLQEVENLVKTRGWDPVLNYGSASGKKVQAGQQWRSTLPARHLPEAGNGQLPQADPGTHIPDDQSSAQNPPQDRDEISERLQREAQRRGTTVQGVVRGIDTLGAWAGASLIAGLKTSATFEIKRDDFPKNGLTSLGHTF